MKKDLTVEEILEKALEHGANMTPEERFQRMIDIGLINEEGEVICDISKALRNENANKQK